ncbi:bifunctional glycosyltransferase family 2 protein/CDP-glycerol:glycerophosphate glycerophosphotransferase [Bacillus pseudomycoides]|uniref:Bifunctional glycosyltransferase family 2 protein/CDP-glycerol:glycerophosphate glycerophosphotransferase n=1 Tax=Bacillus bingmayongensis TaxID=1150157 RepID=A0ABU5JUC8_9BACI|nr:bifunctional glycosyltransferase family 2 protein/CDP-glycerol:glycerophosphate glycerophosphotransferase [Bacillus pseudomycoides]
MSLQENIKLIRRLERMEWKEHVLCVQGHMYISGTELKEKTKLEAMLANPENGKFVFVPIQAQERKDVSFSYGNNKNYDWSGYEIQIDFNNPKILELGVGKLEVWIKLDINGDSEVFKVGGPVKGKSARTHFNVTSLYRVFPKYNKKWDLSLEVDILTSVVQEVKLEGDSLHLYGWTTQTIESTNVGLNEWDLGLCHKYSMKKWDGLETSKELEYIFKSKKIKGFMASIDLSEIENAGNECTWSGYFYVNGERLPLTYAGSSTYLSFIRKDAEIAISKNPAANIQFQYNKISPLMKVASWQNNKLKLKLQIHKNYAAEFESVQEKILILKHKKYRKEYEFQLSEDVKNKEVYILNATIPVTDEHNGIPLNVGEWEAHVLIRGMKNKEEVQSKRIVKYDMDNTNSIKQELVGLVFEVSQDHEHNFIFKVAHVKKNLINPKISVIVPVYNVQEYLEECFDSLVNQTMKEIEVIMVDDGSLDNSAEIMDAYDKKYNNFIPVYKKNGGLGHARNYGVSYATGDFIIFMDSDDYVTKDAYKKMYDTVLKSGSDIVIGNVKRFNSTREYASGLHTKVFKETIIGTHITKNPELMYDTTAWNKLFKRDFWEQHQFKFPEGILYEDIPVTIPAHFLSTSTDVLEDVVYYWRARDGVSKSITQQRNQLKNFTDRMAVLEMGDRFFEESSIDKEYKIEKDYKSLSLDILLYLNQLDDVDEEYLKVFMPMVIKYLENIEPEALERLSAIDRLKYYLVKNNDIAKLLQVLEFQKTKMKFSKVQKEGDRYFGNYPFKETLPAALFDVTNELKIVRKAELAKWNGLNLQLSGYAYIEKLDVKDKNSVNVKACILNPITNKQVELPIQLLKRPDVTHKRGIEVDEKKPLKRLYNYNWSGYEIDIDFGRKDIVDLGEGRLEIWVTITVGSVTRKFRIGGPIAGSKPRPAFKATSSQRVFVRYNKAWDLFLQVDYLKAALSKVTMVDNKFLLEGWTLYPLSQSRFMFAEWDRNIKKNYAIEQTENSSDILDIIKIHGEESVQSFRIQVNVEDLKKDNKAMEWAGYLSVDKQRYPITVLDNALENISYISDRLEVKLSTNPAGNLQVNYKNIAPALKELSWEKDGLNISIKIHQNYWNNSGTIQSKQIVLQSRENGKTAKFNITETLIDGGYLLVTSSMKFIDASNIVSIDVGTWDMYLETEAVVNNQHKTTKKRIRVSDLSSKSFTKHVVSKIKFIPYCTREGNLSIKTVLEWDWIERGPRRQEVIQKWLYPMFRKLPMNKKTVVFQSYWGKSYSCNPRALYEYMQEHYPDYNYVWFFNNENTPVAGNAKRVRINSWKYYYYLARAKYFINNANFPDFYEKKQGAIEIQTLHGTPLKTMGLDVPGETDTEEKRSKFLRRCGRWDYLLSPSRYVTDISRRCFDFKEEILEYGFPRNDLLKKKDNQSQVNAIKQKCGLPLDKKIIMYAPTWRVKKGFNLELDLEKLQKSLGEEYIVVLRMHYFVAKSINIDAYKGFAYNLSSYDDIQELYLISDILITDYSSVMFDYANMNRPILFFTYDLELYRDNLRGLYIDFEKEAPGPLLRTTDEIVESIENIGRYETKNAKKFKAFRKKYCHFDNGEASKRVIETMLEVDIKKSKTRAKNKANFVTRLLNIFR